MSVDIEVSPGGTEADGLPQSASVEVSSPTAG